MSDWRPAAWDCLDFVEPRPTSTLGGLEDSTVLLAALAALTLPWRTARAG